VLLERFQPIERLHEVAGRLQRRAAGHHGRAPAALGRPLHAEFAEQLRSSGRSLKVENMVIDDEDHFTVYPDVITRARARMRARARAGAPAPLYGQ
jgi:hypothetical protein